MKTKSRSVLFLTSLFAATSVAVTAPGPVANAAPCLPDALVSGNVECLSTIPIPGVFGARFKGNNMFVTGLSGLNVYDISDPEAPTEIGNLTLPHFENEDVDLGGDILLI